MHRQIAHKKINKMHLEIRFNNIMLAYLKPVHCNCIEKKSHLLPLCSAEEELP